jgi:DNA-binding LacI/PurR family transcriptional regulator
MSAARNRSAAARMSSAAPRAAEGESAARVTLRAIAQAAKASLTTVSYAMRDSPEISAAERRRIQKIAERLGYRPDPLLTHLMKHLRTQQKAKSAASIALLTLYDDSFVRTMVLGAALRAERLGYALNRINAKAFVGHPEALTRMLLARGISGVLLTPAADPASYGGLLDWSKFSVAAMTYSVVEPRVHRVVAHHFDNAVRVFALLRQRGFKRIALMMAHDMELRANHSYSGAFFRDAHMNGQTPLPVFFLGAHNHRDVRGWFAAHKPEAIVVGSSTHVRQVILPQLGARRCARLAFASLDYVPECDVAGCDQLLEFVGHTALETLVAQIHRHELGMPDRPTVTMIEGRWVEGPGLHPLV